MNNTTNAFVEIYFIRKTLKGLKKSQTEEGDPPAWLLESFLIPYRLRMVIIGSTVFE
jgi:hypothetical protein